jgi:hypothetical protein
MAMEPIGPAIAEELARLGRAIVHRLEVARLAGCCGPGFVEKDQPPHIEFQFKLIP